MTDAPRTDPAPDLTRCPRCDLSYPAAEPSCPRCRRIRQGNLVILSTVIMLVLLTVVGWIGMQFVM